MHHPSLGTGLLLLPLLNLGRAVLATPIDGAQEVLQVPGSLGHKPRKLQGRFLHITDFHPDEFYKVHTSTEEGVACHRGTGLAGTYGAETTDCDSPFSLVNATFDWIAANIKDDIDFVIWTGDSARHDSDEKHPRSASQVLGTNRIIADKFVDAFSTNGQLTVPVVPTFGNNDFLPHNIFYPGPNRWLRNYGDIWNRFIPEEQRHTFQFGGWFFVEVVPNKLAVFSLNTMYFFDRNAGVDGCANPSEPGYQHMDWLRVQLQILRERGMKAILIGHVPPARTETKQNWDETCWQKYTLWLKQYRDIVTASVFGHMNIDHFVLQDTKAVDLAVPVVQRESLDADFAATSKENYLQELRDSWSDIPGSAIKALMEEHGELQGIPTTERHDRRAARKNKGLKKIGGKYAERYQVSLVSPSVVPNYFPTLRVVEYNISGLEDSPVWTDSFDSSAATSPSHTDEWEEYDAHQELKRDVGDVDIEKKKKKKKKKKKPKKDKGPHFVMPDPPSEADLPGPGYFAQPFTLTGYTQYFANLTYINNDISSSDLDGSRWRDGDHSEDKPEHKPRPKDFAYEVEYTTFNDKVFKLKDLTVLNYLKLAYRMGKATDGKSLIADLLEEDFDEEEGEEVAELARLYEEVDDDEDDDLSGADYEQDDDRVEDDGAEAEGKKKKHKKKKKKKKKKNKAWLRFLNRAFVGSVPRDQLEDL